MSAADVLEWLQKCVAALKPGGLVILKENICATGFVVDDDDSSLTRSDAYLQVGCARMTLVCSLLTVRMLYVPLRYHILQAYHCGTGTKLVLGMRAPP